jgi:hypothetical protein
LNGAAHILQKFSDPVQYSCTPLGRSLLGWYCILEDYCCLLSAYTPLLPDEWREQNVRIRQILAREDYPRLSTNERKPRLLDDLWAQLFSLVSPLIYVVAGIPLLKNLEGEERSKAAVQLEAKLKRFETDFMAFAKSRHALEVLEPSTHTISPYHHSRCCPPFPYAPIVLQYPPAGIFQMVIYCTITYINSLVYPSIHARIDSNQKAKVLKVEDGTFYCIETCRTFAGIEYSYYDDPDALFPCFSPMSLAAAMTCPPSLRMWMWCKLAHFEMLGQFSFEALKQNLAVLWGAPEILTHDFSPLSYNAQDKSWVSLGDDVGVTAILGNVNLTDESEYENGGTERELDPLIQLQGIVGLSPRND